MARPTCSSPKCNCAANIGPDRQPITSFALRVDNGDSLDALLDAGIQRLDAAYQQALAGGLLKTDPLLATRPPRVKTAEEKAAEEAAAAAAAAAAEATPTPTPTPDATQSATATFTVQVETPNAASVTASEAAVRGVPGVRSAATTSLALGGISLMRVSFDGSIGRLRAALEARGWQVQEGAGVLRIRRGGGNAAPPAPQNPGAPTGQ
jgi:hypothetical protein